MEARKYLTIGLGCSLALGAIWGCRPPETVKRYGSDALPYTPNPDSDNAFDQYVLCSMKAAKAAEKYLGKTRFSPAEKEDLRKRLGPILRKLAESQSKPCTYVFTPHQPFQRPDYERGWNLLVRTMLWGLEDSVRKKDYDAAVRTCVRATRFGYDLTGGGAVEAAMGLELVGNARRRMLPAIGDLSARQAGELSAGLQKALLRRPNFKQCLRNEQQNLWNMLDQLQTGLSSEESFKVFLPKLVKVPEATVREMNRVVGNRQKSKQFVESLVDEINNKSKWGETNLDLPVNQREKIKRVKRPWTSIYELCFNTSDPVIRMNDLNVTRTRLLMVTAEAQKYRNQTGGWPREAPLTPAMRSDQFGGGTLRYRNDGDTFTIYSVGSDGLDNGGISTDSAHLAPDLTLEAR